MVQVLVIVVVLVLVIPVGFLMSTVLVPAIMGWLMTSNAEAEHEDSELLDVNI